ncbi:MAG: AMP-binding protein [Candidatus Eremiobacteraeota bacterium]|nr:AMP-binding protein [Candidatus Eremiobacteraeota bacterium]
MDPHFKPLHVIDFLIRSAHVYREKTAVVDGDLRRTYPAMLDRVYRFARLLRQKGLRTGDRVAVLAPNVAPMLEAHFAVPLAGGVLCTLNIRLMPDEIGYILGHCGASFVLYDGEFEHLLSERTGHPRLLRMGCGELDALDFEAELASTPNEPFAPEPLDENATIAINYTSGTTGRPKGVMFTYRGAYLNALAEVFHSGLRPESVYLWTVPMFHCNGWCFTWAVPATGATNVCLRKVDYGRILDLIQCEGVTHLCAAPTVLVGIANHPDAKPFARPLHVTTAGAPPSPHTILQMEQLGATVTHVYGLTETYGPFTVCAWKTDWDRHEPQVRAKLKSRQGVPFVTVGVDDLRVVDESMNDVPADGETQGEVVMRGNNVMKGYYKDPDATAKAFRGGYFHSGDVAVMHSDGFIEICDRAKDIIISGGENISTIQVEKVIMEHPAALEVAVVSRPDEKWGEVPKAFITLKPGAQATEDEIIAFCRKYLPGFKTPKAVEFCDLPKTSTGKIQKFVLRDREWAGREKRVN